MVAVRCAGPLRPKMRKFTRLANTQNPAKSATLAGRRKQSKMPTFCTHVPYFSPFFPPKWEKSQNRSLDGGTVRASCQKEYQPSRGITTNLPCRYCALSFRRQKEYQPSRGITTDAFGLRCLVRYEPERISTQSRDYNLVYLDRSRLGRARKNINPVAGLQPAAMGIVRRDVRHARKNINPVAGLQPSSSRSLSIKMRCQKEYQPSRGITTCGARWPTCGERCQKEYQPSRGIKGELATKKGSEQQV